MDIKKKKKILKPQSQTLEILIKQVRVEITGCAYVPEFLAVEPPGLETVG